MANANWKYLRLKVNKLQAVKSAPGGYHQDNRKLNQKTV
jgi:hypothetical protein